MNKNPIDHALEQLASALKSQSSTNVDITEFLRALPKRSLSGEHIAGGKILNFSSSGITDQATKNQILITDESVKIVMLEVDTVKDNLTVQGKIKSESLEVSGLLKAGILEVDEIRADVKLEKHSPLEFKSNKDESIYGKGLLWTGTGTTKQLMLIANPDRLFSSESVDLAKDKILSINNVIVISEKELGPSVVKSNLKELGRLKGLIVDGDVSINQYMFYDSTSDRLGLGIDEPHSALSVAEDGIEVVIGTRESSKGMIGTYASNPFDIVTDAKPRIGIAANGNIMLGNQNFPPIQVSVHGKLAVRVTNPDPDVDLHVNGPIRYHGHIHMYDVVAPSSGEYVKGDIVWNSDPKVGSYAGWMCVSSGNPGRWAAFGPIVNI
jgi:hypothetical protein